MKAPHLIEDAPEPASIGITGRKGGGRAKVIIKMTSSLFFHPF